MTIRDRIANALSGQRLGELEKSIQGLQELNQRLAVAYLDGPYILPPNELVQQLQEYYDPALVQDLVDQLSWESVSGYGGANEDERVRAVNDSKRFWKYSILARWIVNLWTFYGLGESLSITPEDEGEDDLSAMNVWNEFWNADRNQHLTAKDRVDEISRWLLVTGERFFSFYASDLDGETTMRSIQPEQITAIYTNPDDGTEPWFYERRWTPSTGMGQRVLYYPDWSILFNDQVDKHFTTARSAYRLDGEIARMGRTAACVLFVPFLQLDEDSLRGWPLLAPHGTPWIRAQREFMQDRATVARGKASLIRRYTVAGGSRAVDSIKRTLASAFQYSGTSETNPAPTAGSSEVLNKAVTAEELPLSTGASDAKTDGEMFAWMAGLAGGVFPHYMGMGDAYRLATATSMEKPLLLQFSLYRQQLGAMFRKMVRITLQFKERYGGAQYETYEADVSTDRLVEADLSLVTQAVGQLYRDILPTASIPSEAKQKIDVYTIQTVLQALGAQDASEIINDGMYEPEVEEAGLAESHVAEVVNRTCPLCAYGQGLLYPEHKGLIVCANCGKTYDPSVE